MTTIRTRWGRLGMPAVAALAVLAAGCGTEHVDAPGGAGAPPTTSAGAVPGGAADFPCPGETPTRTPAPSTSSAAPTGPPLDHYAENHAFKAPLPLHGRYRCDGLAAVRRIEAALEPVRAGWRADPETIRGALVGLGYPAGKVKVQPGGDFLVDATGLCLSGSTSGGRTTVQAFAGYADGTGCEEPRGGH
ncbi:hypothetical protein [Kitasatospora sp. NPDC059599]|uniref:hypothetical protein n=1 Tax=Kitasatospora sp. NPDC059599 TaxID=3346880 RepID=UPI003687AC0E